ncbi:hypothetical protein FOA52_013858 [Chlamydomonas sp. UWO 241]|nr:hypothetical protein FOA52_013858 [Chlamydomonas sp. UWO 241]
MGMQMPLQQQQQQQQHMIQAQVQAQQQHRQQQLPTLRPPSEWNWRPFVVRACGGGGSGSNSNEQASSGKLDGSSDVGGGGGSSGGEVQEVPPLRRAVEGKPAAKAHAKRPPKALAHPGSARVPPSTRKAGGARKRGARGTARSTDEDEGRGVEKMEAWAGDGAATSATISSGPHQISQAASAAGVPAAQLAAAATAVPGSSADDVLDARPKRSLKDMLRLQGQADGE